MEKQKKVKTYKEYASDRKTILTIICLSFAFILVILLSFGVQLVFRDFNDPNFLTDLLINFALCVYCLYFGIPEAKNLYQKKKDGRYQIAYSLFMKIRDLNKNQDLQMNQWLNNYYLDSKQDYYKSILSAKGITNMQVLDLDLFELNELKHPYKKCWKDTEFHDRPDTYFRSLTEEQISTIREIFEGKIKMEKIPDSYFKTVNGKIVASEYLEQAMIQKKQQRRYALLIFYRVLMVFAFAFIFALFGFKVVQGQVMESIINLVFRVWTMLSSFVYGFAVGKIMVMDQCDALEFKTRVNEQFANDKDFVALNEEELAEQEYKKYQESVIVPEIVEDKILKIE